MSTWQCLSAISLLLAINIQASVAVAQEATPTSALEEIVVTAQKREQPLQEVPIAVTAFTSDQIVATGITTPKDFAKLTPNMAVYESQNVGNVSIVLRGIGQVRNGNPPVAILEDGVLQMSPNQFNQELFDIERIEVLRGPQGALYGRNAIAGAISITTKETSDELEGRVRVGYGNGEDFSFGGALSGAIVEDVLRYRIATVYRNMDGLIHNSTLGENVDYFENYLVRGRLETTPTDNLKIDLRGSSSQFDGGGFYYVAVPDGHPNDTDGAPTFNFPSYNKRDADDFALKIDWEFQGATLTSITALAALDEVFTGDLDFSPANALQATQWLDVDSISQELRLTSPTESQFRWIAGVYWLQSDRNLRTLGEADFDLFAGAPDGIIDGPFLNVDDKFEISSKAVFGEISYDLNENLELAVSLRFDDEKTDQTPLGQAARSISFDKFQPRVVLSYNATDDILTYASYSEGFRGGGLNSSAAPPELREWRAEETRNYEVGMKSVLIGGRLVANAALFYTDFKDQQIFILDIGPDALGQLGRNIESTDLKGLELELVYSPARSLQVTAGVGLIDSEIKELEEFPQFVGNDVPKVPEVELLLGISGILPLGAHKDLSVHADYQHQGEMSWHIDNVDIRNSRDLFNLRLALDIGEWSVSVWGKNIFDESFTDEFYAVEFSGFAADNYFPDRGRRYGIEVAYEF